MYKNYARNPYIIEYEDIRKSRNLWLKEKKRAYSLKYPISLLEGIQNPKNVRSVSPVRYINLKMYTFQMIFLQR